MRRTNLVLNGEVLEEARRALGTKTYSETVNQALAEIWIDFLIDPARIPEARANLADFVTCPPVVQEVLQGFADRSSFDTFKERRDFSSIAHYTPLRAVARHLT